MRTFSPKMELHKKRLARKGSKGKGWLKKRVQKENMTIGSWKHNGTPGHAT